MIFCPDNADHRHLHLSSHVPGLLPACEPLGQIAGVAQTAETAIDSVLVALHHLNPVATNHTRFDVLTVKPLVTLDIESVGAISYWAVGVDQAGPPPIGPTGGR